MFNNDLKIAFRNLAKNRFFSLLNITGLALGMSACLAILLIIRDQLSYDNFHPESDRIYRLHAQQPDGTRLASVPYPLGDAIEHDFDVAETCVRLERSVWGIDATTEDGQLTLPVTGFFTETAFFDLFGFTLEVGNKTNILDEPYTMVLSKTTAERFFGQKNPVGASLNLKGKGIYKIVGVAAKPPAKSDLDFQCLLSAATLPALENAMPTEQDPEKVVQNWGNRYMSYVYLRLKAGKKPEDLSNALQVVAEQRAKAGNPDEQDIHYFSLPLAQLSPKREQMANDVGASAPWFFVVGLGVFLVLLTLFPCLNYANMAISQALARTREIGVRKAIGARAGDVKRMIYTEAILCALLALVLACLIYFPLSKQVIQLFPPEANFKNLLPQPIDYVIFLAFGLTVGLISGWIPARRIAKLAPSAALRGTKKGDLAQSKISGWRSIMLVGQFAVSLLLIIVVATLTGQMRFMALANYGFDRENLVNIDLQKNKAERIAHELRQNAHVRGVTQSSTLVVSNSLEGVDLKRIPADEPLNFHCIGTDHRFIDVMGLQLIAGENFPEKAPEGPETFLIVNEKALKKYGLGSPQEALGKTLWMGENIPLTIRGVIRDFHYRSMEHGLEPFVLRHNPDRQQWLHVRLAPGDPGVAMASLESIWKKYDNIHPFKGEFMDETVEKSHGNATFVSSIAGIFGLLSLSIACMGLLGMVTYTVASRVKEIGVRKVLGASTLQITLTLARFFLILLGISVVIAIPLGLKISNLLLSLFVYRIDIGWGILGSSTAVLLLLGLLTIGVQTLRAARTNPVESLRSE